MANFVFLASSLTILFLAAAFSACLVATCNLKKETTALLLKQNEKQDPAGKAFRVTE